MTQHPSTSDPARAAPPSDEPTIADFLTDGALPALCAALSELAGTPVELYNRDGRRIVPATGPRPWRVIDEPDTDRAARGYPIRSAGQIIGSIFVQGDPPADESLSRAAALLAHTVGELCDTEVATRHRAGELSVLFRLSSLLVLARDTDEVVRVALKSALEVLELDAGSIVLFEDDEAVSAENEELLTIKASHGLSRRWLDSPLPLSRERLFDRLALAGQVVVSEDLLADARVLDRGHVAAEQLGAFIGAGITFQGRPLGVIRLYARSPRSFTEAQRRLIQSIAQQVALGLEHARLIRLRSEDRRIQRQLKLAADVQQRMLPRTMPRTDRFDIAARYTPSFALGGDFYDFAEFGGCLAVMIGDVVGKGVPAALLMSGLRSTTHAHVRAAATLDQAMVRINVSLYHDTLPEEFATLWLGVFDARSLVLTYCSAGHEPPMLFRGGRASDLELGGMVVGLDPNQVYGQRQVRLEPGDTVLCYTDGLTDAASFARERFGKDRVRSAVLGVLRSEPDATAARILEQLHWHLRQFTGLSERADDQTVVLLRVLGA